jgi:beta-galactosidase
MSKIQLRVYAGATKAAWCAAIMALACGQAVGAGREAISLNTDWRFHRGDLPAPGVGQPITSWRWKADTRGEAGAGEMAGGDLATGGDEWKEAKAGDDVFAGRRGFAWFRATLPATAADRPAVSFEGVDDNAVVYLNGQLLGRHKGWNEAFEIPLAKAWQADGPNLLAVLVENTDGRGGIGAASLEGLNDNPAAAADSPFSVEYNDSTWAHVDVPHDYIVDAAFVANADNAHASLPVEPGWYRKNIAIPATDKGRRVWLEFDGVYRNSRMWLNGKPLGTHASGYTSFRYDVTEAAVFGGDNLLTVRVDPVRFEGWWYDGGGIYRPVRMVTVDPVHVAPWGVFVNPSVADVGNGEQADAAVAVGTTLVNETGVATEAKLLSEILDADGKVVAKADATSAIAAGGRAELAQNISLTRAKLWSLEHPYLYRLRSVVQVGGEAVDEVLTNFGVRTIRFDADKGFFLNGKSVKIKGTCNHQDFPGVGSAMPDRLHVWRIEKLKEMGGNAYRCSHHPHSPVVLDTCDRLGMLVMDENRKLGDSAEVLSQVESMVLRDRNHPSIVIWSLCNEEGAQGTPAGARMGKAMAEAIRRLDPTRPITAAMNGGYGTGLTTVVDVQGFNYHTGDYDRLHRQFPALPMMSSESTSAFATRGEYATVKERGTCSEYDLNHAPWGNGTEDGWRTLAERAFMAGGFVWTGFDYKGEPTPYGWPNISTQFGIMDTCGFPKDQYYYYQAWWSDRPVLHIFPHWCWPGREGQEIEVWCYSNCERVELTLNGRSLGGQQMQPNGHLVWKVKYEPGELTATGARRGEQIAEHVETTGAPAGIVLTPDRTRLVADGEDLAVVAVRIADEKGRTVPLADHEVRFSLEGAGKILGVGNGDPTSHEPDKAAKRKAFHGLCLVLVQTRRSAGPITLKAEADGLQTATVTLAAN